MIDGQKWYEGAQAMDARFQEERIRNAAPEMLEALEEARTALSFYGFWMNKQKPGTDYPYGKGAEKRVCAALALAKGRTT